MRIDEIATLLKLLKIDHTLTYYGAESSKQCSINIPMQTRVINITNET